jgi:hypothetical protein
MVIDESDIASPFKTANCSNPKFTTFSAMELTRTISDSWGVEL